MTNQEMMKTYKSFQKLLKQKRELEKKRAELRDKYINCNNDEEDYGTALFVCAKQAEEVQRQMNELINVMKKEAEIQ